MSDRYSQAVDAGLLFYMKSAHMLSVPGFLHEKRALIMKRNEVARYLTLNRAGATGTMPGWYNVTYVINKLPKYFRSICNLMEDLVANISNSRSRAVQWIAQTILFSIYIAGLGRSFNLGKFIQLMKCGEISDFCSNCCCCVKLMIEKTRNVVSVNVFQ